MAVNSEPICGQEKSMLQNLNRRAVLLKSIAHRRGRRDGGSKLQGKEKDIITDAIVLLSFLAHTF